MSGKEFVDAHQAGKSYRTISKEFGLGHSTVTLRARCGIVREPSKEPRVMSKQLKAFLILTNVNEQWSVWPGCQEKATALQKEHCCL